MEDERLERLERYDYLGTSIDCFLDYCLELRIRIIEKARVSFMEIKKVLSVAAT